MWFRSSPYVFSYFVLRQLPRERRGKESTPLYFDTFTSNNLAHQSGITLYLSLTTSGIQHQTKIYSRIQHYQIRSPSLRPRITKNNAISSSCTFFQQIKKVSTDSILLFTFSGFPYTTAIKSFSSLLLLSPIPNFFTTTTTQQWGVLSVFSTP